MRSSNPVLTRLTPETHTGQGQTGYSYGPTTIDPAWGAVTPAEGRMTIDDVVVRTVGLLALTGIAGAITAFLVPDGLLGAVWIGGAIIGLVIGLIISFKRVTSPPLIMTYAVVEGAFLGAVSKAYESVYQGIVIQAVLATFGIFFVMAALYKAKVIRATPRFVRGMIGAMTAAVILILARFVLGLIFGGSFLSDAGPIAILLSLGIIVIGALSFILDFDLVEQSVAQGAPKSTAWLCAFGILVGLIWVYLEVLRLLSYLRGRD